MEPPNEIDAFGRKVKIEWGVFPGYFDISDVKAEIIKEEDRITHTITADKYLTFVDEAKTLPPISALLFNFYDADNIELGASAVELLNFPYDWRPGQRGRARLLLPVEIATVEKIKFMG